ncbi:MAG: alanine racemase [Candidatus Izemoplasmatales bacterium]
MIDRVKALIHLDNLIHNFNLLKSVHQEKRVMAVVKADAYGHGAKEVAKHLEENGCDFFAVTDLLEAIELRDAGIESDILIFGKTSPENIKDLQNYNLIQTVDSYEYAKQLNDKKVQIKIHVIIDTGMSRFGIYCHKEKDLIQAAKEVVDILSLKHLKQEGIYTHFAVADEDRQDFTDQQMHMFDQLIKHLEDQGFTLGLKHCSNSAGTLKIPSGIYDMVRVGIAMYGYPPVKTNLDFLPVMDVYARVIALRDIDVGQGVSYGLTYTAEKPMRIASIAIGYADGYNRLFSNQDYFVHQTKKLNIVGRVCMGVTMVDASEVEIQVGDFVQVFGQNKSLDEMAEKINTITYELLTNMSKKRVVFEYIKA